MQYLKQLITIVFLFSMMPCSYAQFGIKLGLISSKQSIEFLGAKIIGSSNTGALIGLDYRLPLTESLSFRPELQYILKGAGRDEENGLPGSNLNYIEIPLNLEYRIPIGNYHLGLLGGPYFGRLVSASNLEDIDSDDLYSSTEFGYNLGAEFQINNLSFGFTISKGVSNTYVEEIPDLFFDIDDIEAKNRYTSFYIRYGL